MKNAVQKGYRLIKDIVDYFHYGWNSGLLSPYSKAFSTLLIYHLNQFRHSLYTKRNNVKQTEEEKVEKLKRVVKGLHSLLPTDPRFTYSILMVVNHPRPSFLAKSLQSLLTQTTPSYEILIGLEGHQPSSIEQILKKYQESYPHLIKTFRFKSITEKEDFTLNELAKQATGNFLFVMGQEDWIRPDLLFRYEQTLRIFTQPQQVVLNCYENTMNERSYSIPTSEVHKPSFHFPFFFDYVSQNGWLIARSKWEEVGGLRFKYKEAAYEDLLLRLNLTDTIYEVIPLCLYSKRIGSKELQQNKKSRDVFLKALMDYNQAKQLDWQYSPGYGTEHVRAIPMIKNKHLIQVIIPFKDQKKLTLSCIHHLLRQKGVEIKVTAVDNASEDTSIREELSALGLEVLVINEPFNYSRLNNLAVQRTQTASDCDLLLFLNNDVDLEEDALIEMVRWIDQPQIGLVGCRLHYPDGRLQHGGVELNYHRPANQKHWEMQWGHIEKMAVFEQMNQSKKLGIVHAVTAACALIKRQNFLKIGGFDEVWYPIAYSDTNLAVKLDLVGLKCFYTPYAIGVHHESVSRKEGIEDYENSYWLHQLLLKYRHHIPTHSFSLKP